MKETDDTLLVIKVQAGDSQAFNELVQRWHTKIYRFAYRFFVDGSEADEITQKTFIKTYQNVKNLDDPGKFSPWIYRIANNLCLDELKRAGRRKSTPLEAWVERADYGTETSPADELESKELGELIGKALLLIPDEQRVVIILKEYEGLKFREIAEILEVSENTVKSRMYYGLKAVRRILKNWNIHNG